jgi:hypothetical protein
VVSLSVAPVAGGVHARLSTLVRTVLLYRPGGSGRLSAMCLDLNAREVGEGGVVRAYESAASSPSSCGDYQVVRAARSPLVSDVDEQLGVDLRDRTVVVEDRDDREDIVEELEAGGPLLS